MSAAAAKLSISQSAVSQAIREIEDHFNIKLFVRGPNKLYLTDSGRNLMSCASHLISYYGHIESVMRSSRAKPAIHVGAFGPYLLLDLVAEFQKRDSSIEPIIHICSQAELESQLSAGVLDIALLGSHPSIANVTSVLVHTNESVFICHRESKLHPALSSPSPVLELWDLAGMPFLLREESCQISLQFDQTMRAHNIDYIRKGTFNSFEGIFRAVSLDLGIGLVFDRTSDTFSNKFKKVKIKEMDLVQKVFLTYHNKKHITPELTKFAEFALEMIPKLYENKLYKSYI